MAQLLASTFLILIMAGIAKMVIDVQIAKIKHTIEDLKQHFNEN